MSDRDQQGEQACEHLQHDEDGYTEYDLCCRECVRAEGERATVERIAAWLDGQRDKTARGSVAAHMLEVWAEAIRRGDWKQP